MAAEQIVVTPDQALPAKRLTIGTLLRYLVGDREAILQVAGNRNGLWLGLAFVLSAGFAREYDGADLWHEPWHLALPLAASLGTSLVLYALVFMAARGRSVVELKFVAGYRTLLTFYWWTAPLAWLYAVPVEQFMTPGDATAANLWFLAAVSAWRVLLVTRALSVWLRAGFVGVFFIVMFFADSVALLLTFVMPTPIWNIMGGIRLSRPDAVLLDAILTVQIIGRLSWVVWLIGWAMVTGMDEPKWSLAVDGSHSSGRVSKSLWGLAALLMAVGIALLPIGQPQQQRRWQAERLLHSGELDQAVLSMAKLSRDEFPPIWDPPPQIGYGERNPSAADVLVAIDRNSGPDWLRAIYVDKLAQNSRDTLWDVVPIGQDADPAEFENMLSVYEKLVPATALDRQQWEGLWNITSDDRIDVRHRDRLRAYLKTAEGRSE